MQPPASSRKDIPIWFWLAVLLPALLSLVSISQRHAVEAKNLATGMAVEMDAVVNLAASQGIPADVALKNLKAQGVGMVVVSEDSIGERIQRGEIAVLEKDALQTDTVVKLQDAALECRTAELASLVQKSIRARYRPASGDLRDSVAPATLGMARGVSTGLDPIVTGQIQGADLEVIGRIGNPSGGTLSYLQFHVSEAARLGMRYFLPSGDQVLGRRALTTEFLDALKAEEITYLTAEFAKMGGDAGVVAAIPERTIRLHTAQSAELDRLTEPAAIERYAKASRERNIRMLLLRPLTNASEQPLTDFVAFAKKVNERIVKEGGSVGTPQSFEDAGVPRWLFLAIGLSLIPATVLLAQLIAPKLGLLAIIVGLLMAAASALESQRELPALFASILFPILAYVWLERTRPSNALLGFLVVSAVSLVGGLCVAGLLNGLPYMVKAEEFRGIKISVFLPIALAGIYLFGRLGNLKDSLRTPITWGSSALALGLLALIAFMLSRTGNDNPAGVSGLELAFRSLMEDVMHVRPRTKEFLIGHPALLVGIGMLARMKGQDLPAGWGGWTALVLMLGAVGSTSIVNTLCHLHTPVQLSLLRIATGLVLGCILGLLLHGIVKFAMGRGELRGV